MVQQTVIHGGLENAVKSFKFGSLAKLCTARIRIRNEWAGALWATRLSSSLGQ